MARKEINIFGTSSLDFRSEDRWVVIILFIIVPMTRTEQDILKKTQKLEIATEISINPNMKYHPLSSINKQKNTWGRNFPFNGGWFRDIITTWAHMW